MKIGPNNFLGINWEPLLGDSTEYQLWYGDEHNASSRSVRDLDQGLNRWLYEKKPKTDFRGPLNTLQQMAAARRRSDHRKVLRELSHQLNAGLPPLSPATRELGESILKQFPADKGWKLETQKTVTDFTRYASLIPVVATNEITKETHIIDIDSSGTQKTMFTKAKLSAQRRMLEMTHPGQHVTGTWSASINPLDKRSRMIKMTPMEDSGLNKALYGLPFGGGFRNLDNEDRVKMAPLDTSILKRYPLYTGPYARSFSYLDTETGFGREVLSVGAINIALDKDGKVLGRLDNGFFRFYPSRNEKSAGFRMAAQVNNLNNKLIDGYRRQQGAKYSKYWNKKELNELNKYLEGQVVFGHNVDSYDREVLRVGELRPQAKGWFDTYTFMQNNSLSYKGARDLDSWYKLTTGRSMEKGGWEHHQVQADVGAGVESTAMLLADKGRLGKQARFVVDSEKALSLAGADSNLNSWVIDTKTGEYIDMRDISETQGKGRSHLSPFIFGQTPIIGGNVSRKMASIRIEGENREPVYDISYQSLMSAFDHYAYLHGGKVLNLDKGQRMWKDPAQERAAVEDGLQSILNQHPFVKDLLDKDFFSKNPQIQGLVQTGTYSYEPLSTLKFIKPFPSYTTYISRYRQWQGAKSAGITPWEFNETGYELLEQGGVNPPVLPAYSNKLISQGRVYTDLPLEDMQEAMQRGMLPQGFIKTSPAPAPAPAPAPDFSSNIKDMARFTALRGGHKSWFDADGTIFKTYDPTIQYELGNGKTGPVFAAFDAGITTPFETTASMINEDMVKRILDEKKAGTFGGILTTALGAKLRDGSMIPGETDDTLLAKTIKAKEAQRRSLNRALRDYARGKPEYKGVVANITPDEWHVLKSGTNKFDAAVSFGGKKGDILYDDSKREGEPWVAASGEGTWNQVVIPDSVAKASYGGSAPSPGNPSTQAIVPEIATVDDDGIKSLADGFHLEEGDLQARADQMSDAELMADATRELFTQGIGDMKDIVSRMSKAREENVADFNSMRRADAIRAVERSVSMGMNEEQARDFLAERYLHGPQDPFINDLIRYRRGYEKAYSIKQREEESDRAHKAYLTEQEAERRELEIQQNQAASISRDIDHSKKLSGPQKRELQAQADAIIGSSEFTASLHGLRDAFRDAEDQASHFQKALERMMSPVTEAQWYNGELISSTAQSNLGRWEAASKGFVPGILQKPLHFLNAAHKDMWQNWWDQNYALKYKGANALQGVVSNAAGAVGHAAGGQSGEQLAKMIVGLPATVSQIKGNIAQNRMQVFGNHLSQALNLLSAGVQAALVPLKLFGMLLGIGAISFKKFMNSLNNFGMPLTGLSGVNYPSYEGHGMMDILAGMKSGSLNAAAENFGYQSSSLFTMGQFDTKRLISSALLGTFDTTYNTEMSGEEMLSASYDNIMPRYLAADKRTQQNMMTWMKNVDPALAQMVQAGANLGIMKYDTYKDPSHRGIFFKNVSQAERNAFQWDNYEWQGSLRQLDFTKARVAHKIWNTFGRDTMNGVNRSLDAFSQGDYATGINGLIDTFNTLWKRLSKIIASSDLPEVLGDTIRKLGDKLREWLESADWSGIGLKISAMFDPLVDKLIKLLTMFSTLRVDLSNPKHPKITMGGEIERTNVFQQKLRDANFTRLTTDYVGSQELTDAVNKDLTAYMNQVKNSDRDIPTFQILEGIQSIFMKHGLGNDRALHFTDELGTRTLDSNIEAFVRTMEQDPDLRQYEYDRLNMDVTSGNSMRDVLTQFFKGDTRDTARRVMSESIDIARGGIASSRANRNNRNNIDINIRDQNGKNITTISTENGIVTNITDKRFEIGNMMYQIESKGGI